MPWTVTESYLDLALMLTSPARQVSPRTARKQAEMMAAVAAAGGGGDSGEARQVMDTGIDKSLLIYNLIFLKEQFQKNSEPHFCSELRNIKNNEPQIWDRKKRKKVEKKSRNLIKRRENKRI